MQQMQVRDLRETTGKLTIRKQPPGLITCKLHETEDGVKSSGDSSLPDRTGQTKEGFLEKIHGLAGMGGDA